MNEYTLLSKSNYFSGIFNYLLMSLNCLLTFGLYAMLSAYRCLYIETRSHHETAAFFAASKVDFFLRREFIAVPLLLLAMMFVTEFASVSQKSKIQLNMFVFAAICAHALFIAAAPYVF